MSAQTLTLSPAPGLRAREYLRVSRDASGRMVSTDQQTTEHAQIAAESGWSLGVPYAEADAISASRYGRKIRSGFAGLISDLESGAFGADVLIMWEASRGSRRAWEWARLIEALKAAHVCVYVASEARLYDPANARDRKSLRDSASDAEYESDKISVRVGRAMKTEAKNGNPHGRVIYGYQRLYRIDDGSPLAAGEYRLDSGAPRVARQVPHPTEAPAVRLIFASLKAGESLRSVCRALRGEGPSPAMGRQLAAAAEAMRGHAAPGTWTASRVRDVALNVSYAGKRLHLAGVSRGHQPEFSMGDLSDGNWTPLVSFADWQEISERLRAPERLTAGKGRQPKRLLSMIATCDRCGGVLTVRLRNRHGNAREAAIYTCAAGGHVTIDMGQLDALVTAAVQARLSAPDVYPAMTAPEASGQLDAARDALAAVKAELADLAAQLGAGRISATLAAAAEPGIRERLDAATLTVRQLESPVGLSSLGLEPGADIFSRWQAAPLNARRAAVKALFSRVSVSPAGRWPTGPVSDRVSIDWR